MYYPCSENKGADQLRGYREADLRLCFRLGKNPVFSRCGSYELHVENRSSGFPTRYDINGPVKSQKKGRSLKFWIQVEEGLYYLSIENKGTDQLRSYFEADLRLCFRIGKNPIFS